MSVEEIKAIVERFFDELWIEKNIAIGDELPDDVVLHTFGTTARGRDAWAQTVLPLQTGFPDIRFEVEFSIAEADKVAVRWSAEGTHGAEFRGIAPTGRAVKFAGVAIYRVADGKIVEMWSQPDSLGLLQQIGEISV